MDSRGRALLDRYRGLRQRSAVVRHTHEFLVASFYASLRTARRGRRAAFVVIRAVLALLKDNLRKVSALLLPSAPGSQTLFFFYDLREHPITYDLAQQLVIAELERRERGLQMVHLVIVPGEWRYRGYDNYAQAVPDDALTMRKHHLALPMAQLLPSCKGVTLCASREEAEWLRFAVARHVFPAGYEPACSERIVPMARARNPGIPPAQFFPMLRANPEARRWVDQYLADAAGGRRPVVITLRQYGFMSVRNSRLADWIAFAQGLDRDRYVPIFVPDTSQVASSLGPDFRGEVVCEAASCNLSIRMALYEAAYLNISLMQGPLELALYNEACRYAVFIPLDVSPQTQREHLMERGFSIGSDLPFAKPWQRIVWEPDTLSAIRRTFAELESLIDGAGSKV